MKAVSRTGGWLPVVLALFAVTLAIPFFTAKSGDTRTFAFEVNLRATKPGNVQLYYDLGRSFNEADSSALAMAVGVEQVYRLPLPEGDYEALRFDPTTADGVIVLSSARIVDGRDRVILRFSPDQFRPVQQIASARRDGDRLRIEMVPGATDAITLIDGVSPFTLRRSLLDRERLPLLWILGAVTLVWVASQLAAARPAAAALGWARAHPRRAIALAAAAGVAWQMHPVIFDGRSLVSPDTGALLLYEGAPTLPDYQPQPVDVHGSDVGAMMWHHVPFAMIEHRSVFGDHLWPLWNRDNRCGLPLLGQGQSMLGDPLQWLAIATNGASWAWDAKFVIARWLFACGLGLAAWQLEAGLAAALLTALTSAFIGFFAFRYNHAAIFSVCYAPWILVAWSGLSRAAFRPRALWGWLALMLLASVMTLSSGTIKEAYMLLAGVHFTGALVLLWSAQPAALRGRKFAAAAAALGVFALVSAPLWIAFFVALGRSITTYDVPAATQLPIRLAIGFFDGLFYRQLRPAENHLDPSLNFLALLGVGWGLARWRASVRLPAWRALAVGALVPFSLAFTVVPAALIVQLPFIGHIVSVDNTFSCVLLIPVLGLAAFGWGQLLRDLRRASWAQGGPLFLAGLAALLALYFLMLAGSPKSGFFAGYAATLVVAVAVFPWLAARAFGAGQTAAGIAALAACAVLTLWQHGEYRHSPFDFYTLNPGQRVDLRPPSPALAFVRQHALEPARTLGLGQNFFPGYGELSGIETIYGVDPLESPYYDGLARAFGLDHVWDWTGSDAESAVGARLRARDMLNNRYYLATHNGPPRPLPGLWLLGRFDLDVYESPGVWPRAFFTDRAVACDSAAAFARAVQSGDGRPFAAVPGPTLARIDPAGRLRPGAAARTVIPARDYALDGNTTAFTVDAPGPGLVVLGETYYHRDFEARLDGRPVPYFRVNQAFKGIWVDAPGPHRVSFSYWPEYFTLALILGLAGLLLLAGASLWMLACGRRRPPASPAASPSG